MSARTRSRRRRRGGRGVVVAVVAVALVAVGGWWALNRDGGVPVRQRCTATLDGTAWYLSPVQAENAGLIAGASVRRAMPARAATIALATALQESKLVNIDYGDRDSLGLFQQRPSQGWGTQEQVTDPVYATDAFYDALARVADYESLEVTVAAQAVQRSAYPDAYAQHEVRARAWASGLTGHSPAVVTCELWPVATPSASGEVTATFAARAARDLGLDPAAVVVEDGGGDGVVAVRVDAAALPTGDPVRAGWAVAQWAVTTASVTDAVEVRVADRVWSRTDAVRAARDDADPWRTADDGEVTAGTVVVRLAASG